MKGQQVKVRKENVTISGGQSKTKLGVASGKSGRGPCSKVFFDRIRKVKHN